MRKGGYEESFLSKRRDVFSKQPPLPISKEPNVTTVPSKSVTFEDESRSDKSLNLRASKDSGTDPRYRKSDENKENLYDKNDVIKDRTSLDHRPSQEISLVIEENEWKRILTFRPDAGPSKKKMSYVLCTLCQSLQMNPAALEGNKLNLVNMSISIIDRIPTGISSRVNVLYLGNNDIKTVNGIEEFSELQSVSLTNNLIRYLGDLRALGRLEHLVKISLEGNVVTSMPFYRQYVLSLCPLIRSLDGVKVTTEERSGARAASRKISTFYQQLRLNQLQNCVLDHLRKLLTVHSELCNVVMGRFRSLRGSHIPSFGVGTHGDAEAYGVGRVLRHCMGGGVYRWIMLACGEQMDRIVQDLTHRVHLVMLSKLPGSQRMSVVKDPELLSAHWGRVVVECLRHQQQTSLRLVEECEAELDRRVGRSGSGPAAPSADALNALHQLEFESASLMVVAQGYTAVATTVNLPQDELSRRHQEALQREYELTYCGVGFHGDMHSRSRMTSSSGADECCRGRDKGRGNSRERMVYSRSRSQSRSRSPGYRPRRGSSNGRGKDGDDDDDDEDGGYIKREQRLIQERYDSLLRRMSGSGGGGAAGAGDSLAAFEEGTRGGRAADMTATTSLKSNSGGLSDLLPPHQEDPDGPTNAVTGLGVGLPPATHPAVCPSTPQQQSTLRQRLSAGTSPSVALFTDSDVTDFMARAQEPIEELDDWLRGIEAFWRDDQLLQSSSALQGTGLGSGSMPPDIVSNGLVSLTELSASEREAVLGPVPLEPYVFPTEAKSMRGMKEQVDQALQELTLRRRAEALTWEANDALKTRAKSIRKRVLEAADAAVHYYESLRERVQVVIIDVDAAQEWMDPVHGRMREIENAQEEVEAVRAATDRVRAKIGLLATYIADETEREKKLTESSHEVVAAITAMDKELKDTAEITQCLKLQEIEEKVAEFESRRLSLKRSILRLFRLRVRRQKRIKDFYLRGKACRALATVAICVNGWKKFVAVARRGHSLTRHSNLRLLDQHWMQWVLALRRHRDLVCLERAQAGLAKRRALRHWRNTFRARKREKKNHRMLELMIRLKSMFRAWCCVAVANRPDEGREMAGTIKAVRFIKSRVFSAWRLKLAEICNSLHEKEVKIFKRRRNDICGELFHIWHSFATVCRFKRMNDCSRVFRALRSTVSASRLNRSRRLPISRQIRSASRRSQMMHVKGSVVTTKPLVLVRTSQRNLRLAFTYLLEEACVRSKDRFVYERLAARDNRRRLLHTWRRWNEAWLQSCAVKSKYMVAMQHYLDALLSNTFYNWRTYVRKKAAELAYPDGGFESVEGGCTTSNEYRQHGSALAGPSDKHGNNDDVDNISGVHDVDVDVSDDDDDDYGDDGENDNPFMDELQSRYSAVDFRVCLTSFLFRWRARATRSAHLRRLFVKLFHRTETRLQSKALAAVIKIGLQRTRKRLADLDRLIHQDNSKIVSDLRTELSDMGVKLSNLASSISDYSALVVSTNSQVDEMAAQLNDSEASLAVLQQERESVEAETARLREESRVIMALSEAKTGTASWDSRITLDGGSDGPAALLNNASERVGLALTTTAVDDAEEGSEAEKNLDLLEEKMALMRDMEVLYEQAVQSHSEQQRMRQQTVAEVQVASAKCRQLEEDAVSLDARIQGLRDRRSADEQALRACAEALADAQHKILATVDYNERRLSQLDAEKKDAVKRSAMASEAEKLLVSELDEARTILMAHEAKQRKAQSSTSPDVLALVEADSHEYRAKSSVGIATTERLLLEARKEAAAFALSVTTTPDGKRRSNSSGTGIRDVNGNSSSSVGGSQDSPQSVTSVPDDGDVVGPGLSKIIMRPYSYSRSQSNSNSISVAKSVSSSSSTSVTTATATATATASSSSPFGSISKEKSRGNFARSGASTGTALAALSKPVAARLRSHVHRAAVRRAVGAVGSNPHRNPRTVGDRSLSSSGLLSSSMGSENCPSLHLHNNNTTDSDTDNATNGGYCPSGREYGESSDSVGVAVDLEDQISSLSVQIKQRLLSKPL